MIDTDKSQHIEQCIIKYEKVINKAKDNEVLAMIVKSMSFGLI